MYKESWGLKRICPMCRSSYYDLGRTVLECPSCGKEIEVSNLARPRRGRKPGSVNTLNINPPEIQNKPKEDINEDIYKGKPNTNLGKSLAIPIESFSLEKQDFMDILDGMELDTIVLACTHYPMLLDTLKSVFNKLGFSNLNVIESGNAIVDYLHQQSLLTIESHNHFKLIKQSDQFYITDAPHQFNNLANRFLGEEINNIQLISL